MYFALSMIDTLKMQFQSDSNSHSAFSDYKTRPPNLGGKWGCVLYSECSSPGSRGRGGLRLLNILTHFLLQNFFFLFSYSVTWVHLMVPKILYVYKRFWNDILVGSPAKAAMLLNYTKSLVTV